VRLLPKSLAGRLALLLVLTLVVAQLVTFALFAGERIGALHAARREDLLTRMVAMVNLIEQTPPALHDRLAVTASSALFSLRLAPGPPAAGASTGRAERLRGELAAALGKPEADIQVAVADPPWGGRRRHHDDGDLDDDEDGERHHGPRWISASIRLKDGQWLVASAGPPAVPPKGGAILAALQL
jgi:hypothetical protein